MFHQEGLQESQWNSMSQLWKGEPSQVELRYAQSRVFEGVERLELLSAMVDVMQDLGFNIAVLDEELGILSAKRLFSAMEDWERALQGFSYMDRTYVYYEVDRLRSFSRQFLGWGPFVHRENLIRLTATVRTRREDQLLVRVNLQFFMRAVEDPGPYQRFFVSLEERLQVRALSAPEAS